VTGVDSDTIAIIGLALLLAGGTALAVTRKREDETDEGHVTV
jgi:LPXTG-motif cell wall-anchored protein